MNYKLDELYPIYVAYLERKNISKGALQLAKISEQMFLDFKKRCEYSPGFLDNQKKIYKNVVRDIKLNSIFDSDIDDFLNEL